MDQRLSSGLISIEAVGGGNGVVLGAAANNPTAFTLPTGKRAVIKKIWWRNRIGVNANLLIGFGDRTVAGSIFRLAGPRILMVNGIDGQLDENEIPIFGNSSQGFIADTTVPTGTTGAIILETDGAAGTEAAGTNVHVVLEVAIE